MFNAKKTNTIMNKTIIKTLLVFSLTLTSVAANSQNLLDGLKNAAANAASSAVTNATGSSALGNIVSNLLGTGTVSKSSIVGTWSYTEPCLVAESSNILSNVASNVAVGKAQDYLKQGMTKAGITAGQLKITFDEGGNVTFIVGSRKLSGTYTLDGSDINITLLKKTFKMNCKQSSGDLQLAFNAQKLLSLINTLSMKASSASSSLSTVSTLLGNVQGLYVGLQLKKL